MKAKHLLALLPLPFVFVSCENPADKTESATVTDAVEVPATTSAPAQGAVTYSLLPESEIHFVGSKVTGSHNGGFKTFTGAFTVADGKLVGTGQKVEIQMDSIWSDNDNLTGHLKNEDFFNVEKHPTSTFELTGLEAGEGEGTYKVSGNLTILGNTRNLSFPATATMSGDKVSIQAKFDINRTDWGITYAGKTDDLIRNEVVIELKLVAAPQSTPEA
jgi:polyisoprenoid-binding protein YceI